MFTRPNMYVPQFWKFLEFFKCSKIYGEIYGKIRWRKGELVLGSIHWLNAKKKNLICNLDQKRKYFVHGFTASRVKEGRQENGH